MSISSGSPLSPMVNELQSRIQDLDNEVLMLRSQLEQQSWRMAQLVLENTALKAELGSDPAVRDAARIASRNRAAVVTREEMEFALSMGRGLSRPSPETLRRR